MPNTEAVFRNEWTRRGSRSRIISRTASFLFKRHYAQNVFPAAISFAAAIAREADRRPTFENEAETFRNIELHVGRKADDLPTFESWQPQNKCLAVDLQHFIWEVIFSRDNFFVPLDYYPSMMLE